ncbi:MAG: response regulator [Lachnospiraceae bacterium]|nr:response regulator [Lachnospiraceae bacterium]
MIVDDEQIIREALSEMIDYPKLGYELIAAAKNGMEAYDIICDEYPDVVITDIRMPFLNGLELIERSIKADSKITFILLSGYSEFEYAKQAMKYGVRYYLLKPTDKQELIDILISIRQDTKLKEQQKKEEQERLLFSLQAPLEQCFIMESLTRPEEFSSIFKRYQGLLSIPSSGLYACICSNMEEACLKDFAKAAQQTALACGADHAFPVIYAGNHAALIFSAPRPECGAKIRSSLCSCPQYPGQPASFDVHFLQGPDSKALFYEILLRILRYERILLIYHTSEIYEFHNNLASPWHISQIEASLASAKGNSEIRQLLEHIFIPSMSMDMAKTLALSLFLKQYPGEKVLSLNIACDFFRKLYSCPDIPNLQALMEVVLLQENPISVSPKNSANISLLKSYVEQHLDSENLSLKWLAENYLFVSVGYLSKQFVKEEGLRFSEYLNNKRMEEAVRLMVRYHNDNIKTIAKSVGFGSNPQYFSQVFKRYTGLTPTEYIEKQNLGNT